MDGHPQAFSDPRMALGACQEIPWPQAQDDFLISQAVIDLGMKKWFAIVAVGVTRAHPASFHQLADLRGFCVWKTRSVWATGGRYCFSKVAPSL